MILPLSNKVPAIFGIFAVACLIVALALLSVALEPKQLLAMLVGLLGTVVILTRPFAGLFMLVFFVQLSAIVDRIAPSDWAIEGLVLLTIAGSVINSPQLPKNVRWGGGSPAFRMACLFVITAGVSTFFAKYPEVAKSGLIKFISMLVVFFLVMVLVQTKQRIKLLLFAIMTSTLISAGISNIGHLTGHLPLGLETVSVSSHQAGASSVSPTTSANMMLVGTIIAALLALRSPKWRLFSAITAVVGTSGIIFTFTRSAAFLLAVGCGWIAVKFRRAKHFPAVLIISILLGLSILPLMPQHLWDRFASIGDPSSDWTLGRRLGYHIVGLDLLTDNPVLGVGPNNFRQYYIEYEYRWVEGRQLENRALHNMYLSVAAETGILGFTFFAAMILISLIGLNRVRKTSQDPELRTLAEAIQIGYVLFLIAAGSLPAVTNKYTWILTGLAATIASIADRSEKLRSPQPVASNIDTEETLQNTG